jgi:hypothetical protein
MFVVLAMDAAAVMPQCAGQADACSPTLSAVTTHLLLVLLLLLRGPMQVPELLKDRAHPLAVATDCVQVRTAGPVLQPLVSHCVCSCSSHGWQRCRITGLSCPPAHPAMLLRCNMLVHLQANSLGTQSAYIY